MSDPIRMGDDRFRELGRKKGYSQEGYDLVRILGPALAADAANSDNAAAPTIVRT